MARRCKDCHYGAFTGNEAGVACHRFPPTVMHADTTTVSSYFPMVNNDSWCGEFKPGKDTAQPETGLTIPRHKRRQ